MRCLILTAFILLSSISFAEIRIPEFLSSNMVLQQHAEVNLWGWANPFEKIIVTTSWGSIDSVLANGNAKWSIKLKTPAAGGPYQIDFRGSNTISLKNILIGEVWLCSGQSNMEWSYRQGVKQIAGEFNNPLNKQIRILQIEKKTSGFPQEDIQAVWQIADSNNLKSFSAVGYFFGLHLAASMNVPVGLINASWGGTPAEVWTPAHLVENDRDLQYAASLNGKSPWVPNKPGAIYNAMIAPFQPMKIAGVIWYQGESNTNTASYYTALMKAMIEGWRENFQQDFPFYFVQIAPFRYDKQNIAALLREAQSDLLPQLQKTAMVVTSDIYGDSLDIHPLNKKDVGVRLADIALSEHYPAKEGNFQSPMFRDMTITRDKISLEFLNANEGLEARGKKIVGFEIAGSDRIFYPAEGKIEGQKVILSSSSEVNEPVAVRYGFHNTRTGNLFGKNGLPLAPFRTDRWPVSTASIN